MSEPQPPTNSPFHQPATERVPLEGVALRQAQADTNQTASERAARDRRPYDFLNDPDIVHVSDGQGGTIYKVRETGQVLNHDEVLAGHRRDY